VCGVFDGAPGAWPKFIGHWFLRSALILPGFAIAGLRDKRLITGSLASSTMISLFLMLFTAVERGRMGMPAIQRRRRKNNAMQGRQLRAHKIQRQLVLSARRRQARRVSSLAMLSS
jgi:hypothetical protein